MVKKVALWDFLRIKGDIMRCIVYKQFQIRINNSVSFTVVNTEGKELGEFTSIEDAKLAIDAI